jgi:hypothetical protein
MAEKTGNQKTDCATTTVERTPLRSCFRTVSVPRPVGDPFQLSAFDSPSLHISEDISRAEIDVSATDVVLTMKSVSGSVWMLDGVDR